MENHIEGLVLKEDEGVRVVRTGDLVVKKVFGKNEGFCRLLKYNPEEIVSREIKALKLLEGLEGIQRFSCSLEKNKMVTRYVQGKHLGKYEKEELPFGYFKALEGLVMQCNSRGVYRVGSKQDFLITPEGKPAIIDFGSVLFDDDSLLKIPGVKRIVKHRVMSKLKRMKREFYRTS